MRRIFTEIARVLTGVLFVFSGLIKANDPVGFGYKLQEYFLVFGMDFLNDHATFIAVIICSIEILLGGLLLLGFWRKRVVWGLLLLIGFFTFLTFYSAFFEVVTSCGCFGDAIPLTPWQSFIKDLILLALILVLFKNWRLMRPLEADQYTKSILTVLLVVLSVGVGVYTVNYLPVIDFLPYKKGNHLPSLMVMPDGEEGDVYELTYQMKNKEDGEEMQITDKQYMEEEWWKNESWEIIGEPSSRLLKKGYQVPITDLLISDVMGNDMTSTIIENPFDNIIVVAWDLANTNKEALKQINETITEAALNYNMRVVLLTSATSRQAEDLSDELGLLTEIFYADAVPLKSMVRANPGVLLMKIIKPFHRMKIWTAVISQ